MSGMEWTMKPEDELGMKDGDMVVVNVVANRDGDIVKVGKTNPSEPGKEPRDYISIQLQVAEGEHKSRRTSMTLWPDPTDWRFRKQIETLTGVDLADGARVTLDDIIAALNDHSFRVEIMRDAKDPRYTKVKVIHERLPKVGNDGPEITGGGYVAPTEDFGLSY